MRYLKSDLSDRFQDPMIIYRLVEYDQKSDTTTDDTIVIYTNLHTIENGSESGDKEDSLVESLITQGYKEVSKVEYEKDIKDKPKKE